MSIDTAALTEYRAELEREADLATARKIEETFPGWSVSPLGNGRYSAMRVRRETKQFATGLPEVVAQTVKYHESRDQRQRSTTREDD